MRQITGVFLSLAALAAAPAATAADGISYNYVDVGYLSIDPDGLSDDFSGVGLRGSYLLNDNVFLAGEFDATSLDDFDRTDIALGAGYRWPINNKADFYGQLDYLNVEVDPGFDEDGLRLTGGIRVAMSDRFELRGAVQYVDVVDSDTVLNIGAEYNFASNVAGFVELRESDDYGGYFLGARFEF